MKETVHEIDDVKCGVCGRLFGQITSPHLKFHGITMAEYVKLFPNLPLISLSTERKRIENLSGRKLSNEHKLSLSKTHADMSGSNNPMFGKQHTKEARKLMGENHRDMSGDNHPKGMLGKRHTEETKQKMRDSSQRRSGKDNPMFGKRHTETALELISLASSGENNPHFGVKVPLDQKIEHSCLMRGIVIDDFDGFASESEYCDKWNEKIRQTVRNRYDNCDFMSGIPDNVCNVLNGMVYKLDVHHVDMNKDQGCNDHEWKLIPLSRSNHSKTIGNRSFWERLICYALEYDETYYTDEIRNIFVN